MNDVKLDLGQGLQTSGPVQQAMGLHWVGQERVAKVVPCRSAQDAHRFEQRAQRQKQAAEQAGASGHWQALHAVQETPVQVAEGRDPCVWSITSWQPLSLSGFQLQSAWIEPADVYHLAHSVAAGLAELHASDKAGHGALKPENVLLDDRPNRNVLHKARIRLCDPAPRKEALSRPKADQQALGEMLAELIAGRVPDPDALMPFSDLLDDQREVWEHTLGHREARRWYELCRELIVGEDAMDGPALLARVQALRPRRGGSVMTSVGVVAVGVALLAAGGLWFSGESTPAPYQAFIRWGADEAWVERAHEADRLRQLAQQQAPGLLAWLDQATRVHGTQAELRDRYDNHLDRCAAALSLRPNSEAFAQHFSESLTRELAQASEGQRVQQAATATRALASSIEPWARERSPLAQLLRELEADGNGAGRDLSRELRSAVLARTDPQAHPQTFLLHLELAVRLAEPLRRLWDLGQTLAEPETSQQVAGEPGEPIRQWLANLPEALSEEVRDGLPDPPSPASIQAYVQRLRDDAEALSRLRAVLPQLQGDPERASGSVMADAAERLSHQRPARAATTLSQAVRQTAAFESENREELLQRARQSLERARSLQRLAADYAPEAMGQAIQALASRLTSSDPAALDPATLAELSQGARQLDERYLAPATTGSDRQSLQTALQRLEERRDQRAAAIEQTWSGPDAAGLLQTLQGRFQAARQGSESALRLPDVRAFDGARSEAVQRLSDALPPELFQPDQALLSRFDDAAKRIRDLRAERDEPAWSKLLEAGQRWQQRWRERHRPLVQALPEDPRAQWTRFEQALKWVESSIQAVQACREALAEWPESQRPEKARQLEAIVKTLREQALAKLGEPEAWGQWEGQGEALSGLRAQLVRSRWQADPELRNAWQAVEEAQAALAKAWPELGEAIKAARDALGAGTVERVQALAKRLQQVQQELGPLQTVADNGFGQWPEHERARLEAALKQRRQAAVAYAQGVLDRRPGQDPPKRPELSEPESWTDPSFTVKKAIDDFQQRLQALDDTPWKPTAERWASAYADLSRPLTASALEPWLRALTRTLNIEAEPPTLRGVPVLRESWRQWLSELQEQAAEGKVPLRAIAERADERQQALTAILKAFVEKTRRFNRAAREQPSPSDWQSEAVREWINAYQQQMIRKAVGGEAKADEAFINTLHDLLSFRTDLADLEKRLNAGGDLSDADRALFSSAEEAWRGFSPRLRQQVVGLSELAESKDLDKLLDAMAEAQTKPRQARAAGQRLADLWGLDARGLAERRDAGDASAIDVSAMVRFAEVAASRDGLWSGNATAAERVATLLSREVGREPALLPAVMLPEGRLSASEGRRRVIEAGWSIVADRGEAFLGEPADLIRWDRGLQRLPEGLGLDHPKRAEVYRQRLAAMSGEAVQGMLLRRQDPPRPDLARWAMKVLIEDHDYPASVEALKRFPELTRHLGDDGLSVERRGALLTRLAAERAGAGADRAALASLIQVGQEALSLGPEQLPPGPRLVQVLHALAQPGLELSQAVSGSGELLAASERFAEQTPGGAQPAGWTQWVQTVRAAKGELTAAAKQGAGQLDPLKSAWADRWSQQGNRWSLRWELRRGGNASGLIQFIPVNVPDGGRVMMSSTEVPLGLLAGVVQSWPDRLRDAAGTLGLSPDANGRQGMQGWEPARGQVIRLRSRWLGDQGAGVRPYPVGMLNARGDGLAEEAGGPPSWHHPAHWIEPTVAVRVAATLGCRLPTTAEWRAAWQASSGGELQPDDNLRGGRYAAQYGHYIDAALTTAPYAGVFPEYRSQDAWMSFANHDDGHLWLRRVPDPQEPPAFRDLAGNVGEYVMNQPAAIAADARADDWQSLVAVLDRHWDQLGVIGGSALSVPMRAEQLQAEQPVKQRRRRGRRYRQGYCDIGFRLAFSVTRWDQPLNRLLRDAPSPQALLQPAGEANP